MALDPTDDDPSMGQGGPSPDPTGGAMGGGPPGGGAPPQAPQGPGPGLIAMARNRMGPQVSAPGPGNQADSMTKIIQAINLLKMAGLGLQPGDKLHTDVYNTINRLSRHLGGVAGMAPAAGVQKTMLGDQMKDTVKNMLLARILGGQQGPGGAGGGGPGQGGASPPMPSTPLPGT
jgi:hypothetical protein